MNKKISPFPYSRIVMSVLLSAFMVFLTISISSASNAANVTPTPAPLINDQTALTRQDMMDIAERFRTYKWRASTQNIEHDIDYHNKVDTPDIDWCGSSSWGCWQYGDAINVGLPYYWGGHNAIRNDALNNDQPDLNLAPIDVITGRRERFCIILMNLSQLANLLGMS